MRMLTNRTKIAAALVAAVFGAPTAALAAAVNVDLDTGTAGIQASRDVSNPPQSFPATINFVGDATVTNVSGRLDYDTTRLDATVTAASGAVCAVNEGAGQIAFTTTSGSGTALGSQVVCNVTFTVPAGVTPPQTIPLAFSNMTFAGTSGTDTTEGGTINVTTGPTAPQLTFNPPAGGTVTLNTGGAGTIAVTAGAGTAGETAALTCSSTNGTATVSGSPFAPNGTGSIAVQCSPVVGATAPFTVNCNVDQSTGTDQGAVTFNATCPAITPSPEFSANLNVSLTGAPGSTLTGGATISNTGNAPLTVGPCTVTGAFTVTPPASIPAGGTGTLGVSCVAPASAGAIATGTAVCTTNDPDDGEGTVTFTLSCGAQVLAVPAMGSFGKGILAALLAGLGLLVFAMRRRASV